VPSWRPFSFAPAGELWRHPDFLRLWGAQTVSSFGTQVSLIALPLIAIVTLDASPLAVGLLAASGTLPFPLFGLFAGVLADRARRRTILIWTDLGRAALLAILPLSWWLDLLSLSLLIVVAFLAGTLTVFFDITAQSYLPEVVGRERLVDANAKFAVSSAGAHIAGPGIGGLLVQILSAPAAIIVDALSFLWSAVLIGRIRHAPGSLPAPGGRTPMLDDIREGLGFVWRHTYLRPIASCTATLNLSVGMAGALLILFATRELEIPAGLLGLLLAGSGLGGLLGARFAGRLSERLGIGRAIIAGALVTATGAALIPLAAGGIALAVVTVAAAQIVYTTGTVIYDVTQVSFRQAVTPDALLGRMNATIRVLIWGTLPLGSLLGGFLGGLIGLRPTLALAVAGMFLAVLWIALSDVRALRSLPAVETARAT
jgi:MFS family permease